MKNKKLVFQVQYVIFCLASIVMMFLSFFNMKITIKELDSISPHYMNGVDYIKLLKDPTDALLKGYDMLGVHTLSNVTRMIGIGLFAIPFVIMLVGIIVHLISMRNQKGSMIHAIFPGLALFLTIIELIVVNLVLNNKVSTDKTGVAIIPYIGCIVFMVIAFLLLLEDILILSKNVESNNDYGQYPAQNYYGNDSAIPYGRPAEFPQEQDDITEYYRDSANNAMSFASEQVTVGKLTCIRGEYRGAEIVMRQGEMITLGRDQEICQLVFTDPHISRRHCIVIFQPDGTYSLTNLSKNGVKLHDGTDLPYNLPMTVPANTAFRLNEEVVFRVG